MAANVGTIVFRLTFAYTDFYKIEKYTLFLHSIYLCLIDNPVKFVYDNDRTTKIYGLVGEATAGIRAAAAKWWRHDKQVNSPRQP